MSIPAIDGLSTHYDSAPETSEQHDRLRNVTTRPERKRNWDTYNQDLMKGCMDEFKALLSSQLAIQDDRLSKSLFEAVGEIKTQCSEVKDELSTLNSSVSNIREELDAIKNQYSNVTRSISVLKEGQSSILSDFKSLTESFEFSSGQIRDLNERVKKVETSAKLPGKVESEIAILRSTVNDLQYRLHQQQQWDRQQNLEVTGVPESKNENLIELTIKIAKLAGVDLVREDIIHAVRIQPLVSNPKRPKSIVIKLNNRTHKDKILAGLHKKMLTTLDLSMSMAGDNARVYVAEHLTVENKRLFKACRDARKAKDYKFCWVKNGRLFMRKNDTSPVIHIKQDTDLQKLH
uniref:FP protein C-terminal domain-containing protein n=1 Tax=Pectinophora gossypiella TaxID=13191 RepID=A0A1E1WIH3_PECGO